MATEGTAAGDAQRPGRFDVTGGDHRLRARQVGFDVAHLRQVQRAGLAEGQLPRTPVQQPYAQMGLQPVDVLADRGGADAKDAGAAAMLPVSAVRVKLRISCNRFMTDQLATGRSKYRLVLNQAGRLHP